MPFCQTVLKAPRPLPPAYPRELKTLGDHLRKRRLDLKLLQSQVAEKIGVDEATVCNWENNRTSPALKFIPRTIQFLGYSPYEHKSGKSLRERIIIYRQMLGLTQKELARHLGVDPSTLARWEKGRSIPTERFLHALSLLFTSPSSDAAGLGE